MSIKEKIKEHQDKKFNDKLARYQKLDNLEKLDSILSETYHKVNFYKDGHYSWINIDPLHLNMSLPYLIVPLGVIAQGLYLNSKKTQHAVDYLTAPENSQILSNLYAETNLDTPQNIAEFLVNTDSQLAITSGVNEYLSNLSTTYYGLTLAATLLGATAISAYVYFNDKNQQKSTKESKLDRALKEQSVLEARRNELLQKYNLSTIDYPLPKPSEQKTTYPPKELYTRR